MKTAKQILSIFLAVGLLVTLCGSAIKPKPEENLVLAHSQTLAEGAADYRYNAQGQITKKIQDTTQTRYQYHENGLLKTETVFSGEKIDAVREYDRMGNLLRTSEKELTNHYDDQGRLARQVERRSDGMEKILAYTYEEDGSFTIELSDSFTKDGAQVPHCHRTATFTKEGTLISLHEDLADMQPLRREEHVTLDRLGNVEQITQEYQDENTSEKREYTYINTYNASNHLLQRYEYLSYVRKAENKAEERIPSTLWCETEYVYDTEDRLVNERRFYPDQGFGSSRMENTWEYDVQGNLVRFCGIAELSDLDYFLQGKGDRTAEADETYRYAPLHTLLDPDEPPADPLF